MQNAAGKWETMSEERLGDLKTGNEGNSSR